MLNPRVAGRYAKSLLDLAVERNLLEDVHNDMLLLQSMCKSSRDFVTLLRSPVIKADKKNKILAALTEGKVSQLTSSFLTLMTTKGREETLPEIATAFLGMYNTMKGISKVKLITAQPVSDALKQSIIDKMQSSNPSQQIQLETAVNENLIGGFVLEYNNNMVDASVLRDLKDIKKQFEQNVYVQRIR
ncbi:MAG: ATP synthase F1 subunit delta [Williamsia sp.]|nr:ATP synthase F1 subunit delta [Williamsia sp.]